MVRLALVGLISLLLVGSTAPLALGASPTPTPSPSSSKTKPSPTPKSNQNQNPPAVKVPVGKAPAAPTSLRERTARATRQFDPATMAITNCQQTIPGTTTTPPTCGFDLWARSGNVTPGDAPGLTTPMPIWGFTLDDGEQGHVPGPILIVKQGQTIRIRLHNQLPAAAGSLSLEIPASNLWPDSDGILRGQAKYYYIAGLQPGTYTYQAGPTPDGPRELMMGLAGLLIVRPTGYTATATSAYGTTASQFAAEATLQTNEFDSGFNRAPFTFDLNTYEPDVFLVNGQGFRPGGEGGNGQDAGPIEVLAGTTLLLHYANLGNHDRGFTVLNHRQRILMDDSSGNFANPLGTGQFLQRAADVATKWLTPGQVSDSFITLDPQYTEGTRIPVYESGFHLWSPDGTPGLGGMMTFLLVHGLNGTPTGPVTNVTVNAPTVAGSTPSTGFTGTQSLTFTGTMTGEAALQAEWFLDTLAAPGSGRPFNATECDGGFTLRLSDGVAFSCTISAARLNALLLAAPPVDGDHVIWVHGRSAAGWGAVGGDVFTYNVSGPDTGALSVHVTPTNGLRINDIANGAGLGGSYLPMSDVVLLGTSTQSLADWNVLKAEYCLDSTACANGSGTPMYLTPPMTAGTALNPTLVLDPAGTACSSATVDYGTPGNPNKLPAPPGGGPIVAWCGFVSAAVLNGTPATSTTPATPALSEGPHTLYAHAYEVPPGGGTTGGRWGDYKIAGASIQFVVDRTPPVVSSIAIDPSPNNGNSSQAGNLNFLDALQVAAMITDPANPIASNIAGAEVFVTDTTKSPAANPSLFTTGTGAEMIPATAVWGDAPGKKGYAYIPLSILTSYKDGLVRFWVHAQDTAGNWGDFASTDMILDRTPPVLTAVAPTPIGTQLGTCSANPTTNPCTIHFSATDPGAVATPIISGEWFLGQNIVRLPGDDVATSNDPGRGHGIPFSIIPSAITVNDRTFQVTPALIAQYLVSINATVATLPPGTTLNIVFRVRDAAGNWSNNTYVVGTA